LTVTLYYASLVTTSRNSYHFEQGRHSITAANFVVEYWTTK